MPIEQPPITKTHPAFDLGERGEMKQKSVVRCGEIVDHGIIGNVPVGKDQKERKLEPGLQPAERQV